MNIIEAIVQLSNDFRTWVTKNLERKADSDHTHTKDEVGLYISNTEPVNAVNGDIWIDTSEDTSYAEEVGF